MGLEYLVKATSLQKVISSMLIRNLEGLNVAPAEIEAYAKDAARNNALHLSFANTQLLSMHEMYSTAPFLFPLKKRYARLSTDITSNFLLSTDFFINKMDEHKPVRYSGNVYDMYRSGCANPFSGLYYKA